MHPHCDETLARRLERLSADEMRRFVETARALDQFSEAALIEIAGGVVAYLGDGSPVNQAVALGFDGEVSQSDIEQVEEFFSHRGQRGLIVTSPLAHMSLFSVLGKRGWVVDGFENVLVRPLSGLEARAALAPDGVTVVRVDDDDDHRHLWAHIATVGFSAPLEPMPDQLALGRVVSHRRGSTLLLAQIDGRPAGTGEVFCADGVAWLSADATLPQFRRRGVQAALQRERLRIGAENGCEIAVSEAVPGGASQRNMERLGFRVAYTRTDFAAPVLVGGSKEENA